MKKFKKGLVSLVLTASLLSFPMVTLGAENSIHTNSVFTDLTTFSANPHSSLDYQTDVEKHILSEFNAGAYDINSPLIKVDPYGWSPLTALVLFDTEEPATVEITVKGKDKHVTINQKFETSSAHHEIPVYGLYPGKTNEVTLKVKYQKGKTVVKKFNIKTNPLPEDFPKVNVVKSDPGQMQDGLTFVVSPGTNRNRTFATDQNGDVRWFLNDKNVGVVNPVRRLQNGHILLGSEKITSGYYHDSFYEMDLLGKIFKEYLRNGIHHEVTEMPNGDFLVDTNKYGRDTVEDYIVILDRETGKVKDSVDLREIFNAWQRDPSKPNEVIPDPTYNNKKDWLHINAIWYVEADNSILISARHQDVVFKVDLDTKEVVWILSNPDDVWPDNLKSKLLTPAAGDEDFEYQYGQHAVMQLPNGDIFLFDNGNYRSKDPATALPDDKNYSRGVIYRVNEKDMTVEQVWQYGKERGSELYSPYICDVDYFDEGHYLIDFGGVGGFRSPTATANIIELKNDKVIYEIEISGKGSANFYRAERIKAYDGDKEYELGKHIGQQLGLLFHSSEVEQ